MKIKMLDLTRQYDKIRHEIRPVVDSIIESQHFVGGPIIKKFEKNFASFCNTKFAVGCSSGTDALLMSLIALNIGYGDEVITTPFTFFATVEAIIRRGATPVFVDVNKDTFNIDVLKIESAITDKTKAIVPVHLFGQCANMDEINQISKKYNLFVIEDAAQAVGSEWNGSCAGSMGTVGCFSFFPSKNLGAFGDGGIVTTNNENLYKKMLATRQHGINIEKPYYYNHIGGNFRLDAIQAGVLDVKMKYIEQWQQMRRENAEYYNKNLKKVETPFNMPQSLHVYNQYVIKCKNRDELRQKLFDRGIGCSIYYPHPIHLQECVSSLGYKKRDFPNCEALCLEVLALPIYPELKKEELDYIIEVINTQ